MGLTVGPGRRGFACLIASLLISAGVSGVPSRAQSGPNDPGFEFQWGLTQIGAQEAWATGTGRGATVAVLDTGVDLPHEDLVGRLLSGGRDTAGNEESPQDDNGSGTHVAGIVAAATNNSTGVAGVAHGARVLPVKVLDSDGDAFERSILQGIDLAIENKVNVVLINLDEDTILADGGFNFEERVVRAWNAGIVPVVNSDHSLVRSRQFSDAPALVVGAVTREGNAAPANDGVGAARWGISAPGGAGAGDDSDIFSTYLPGTRRDGLGGTREYGRYVYEAGNIQAAAHVAGAAAILRGLGQTPQQSVERLLSSATDAGVTGRDRLYGVGLLHAGKAVRGLAPQQAGASGTGSPTTAPPSGGGNAPPPGGGAGSPARPEPVRPEGPAGTAPAAPDGVSTPAGAEPPTDPANASQDEGGDVPDGLAASPNRESMPGRTPLLPLVAFLLLVGSGTIAWALRRRTLEPSPPVNSPT